MKQILVGLDGSPRAAGILSSAATVARATGAKLTLVRSVGIPPDVPEDFWKTTDEPLIELLQRHARESLEVLAASAPKELLGGCEVIVGVPWQTVCDRARENRRQSRGRRLTRLRRARPPARDDRRQDSQSRPLLRPGRAGSPVRGEALTRSLPCWGRGPSTQTRKWAMTDLNCQPTD